MAIAENTEWSHIPGACVPTYHPAYILRAYTEDNRKKVWSDLQMVMQKIK